MLRVEKVEKYIQDSASYVGVCVLNDKEKLYAYQEDESFDTACSIMVFIMLEYFKQKLEGKITGEECLVYTEDNYAAGAGSVKLLDYGSEVKAKDLVDLMIIISDHVAANMLIDFLGLENINECIQKYGFKKTILRHKFIIPKKKNMAYSTPYELARFYRMLAKNEFLTENECVCMKEILKKQKYKDILSEFIVDSGEKKFIDVASKSGKADGRIYDEITNSYIADAGIVFTTVGEYYIALLAELDYQSSYSLNDLKATLQKISLEIFKEMVGEEQ